ncbi:ATP-binding cassette domain-containing protein [Myxococcus sp. RHSTA-1-4]|uniref:ATP-binding cassette domain-containing protein n=1 Tax=Myxococcus sp. RHSTA-1-4 TaxID=2874601 RepID=UPI001CBF8578|nr:ATP-binding cassette domain-containing protein [Myxococcus sp. RHSTA-1-4]MBZ4418455.1 ATP-binding cassette domain-containing protein [Myxococcus sp. RHSTA-1-4]
MIRLRPTDGRRRLAPEVIQSSWMDCGPAALKCLLEGFGIPVSYGRLREACQTDVDGTSIDTLEEVARRCGLEAEQTLVPADHLLEPAAGTLPAVVVVQLPSGATHFVVVWRRHGRLVQVMDPSRGRRWVPLRSFIGELYLHTTALPASVWRDWAGSATSLAVLRGQLRDLGLSDEEIDGHQRVALADCGWHSLAALEATRKMVGYLVRSGGLSAGRPAARAVDTFFTQALREPPFGPVTVAPPYWPVIPLPGEEEEEPRLVFRGAVVVHTAGRRQTSRPEETTAETSPPQADLPPELAAALAEPPPRPGHELLRMLRADGLLAPAALIAGLALAAFGTLGEALLLRGLLEVSGRLSLVSQWLEALLALCFFLSLCLGLDLLNGLSMRRLGRRLEVRFRMAFLEKLPRMHDRYFSSRPHSDMAERCHSLHRLRLLPGLGGQLVLSAFELLLTTAGLILLDPAAAPLAVGLMLVALLAPLALQPVLAERELRVRSHGAMLSRFYLDALLGLVSVRAHGAERALRREHEGHVVEWARSGVAMQRVSVVAEGLLALAGLGLAVALVFGHLARTASLSSSLLFLYWTLNLPMLGQKLAQLARQYPLHRNVTLRLLEPLGALDDAHAPANTPGLTHAERREPGVAVDFQQVAVRAGGHSVLQDVDLSIAPGSHVAIVGPSGAGKSSLAGLLVGWQRVSEGTLRVDGVPLDGAGLERLRRETAWVDPSVHLWNRSFLDNLTYGAASELPTSLSPVIATADLLSVLETLPDGLQTALGEGGARVSGGEGQRMRFGRALLRPGVRLALLDEPFRGLDRVKRHELLERARRLWADATMLCITHDVAETRGFDRVLVVEAGRVVEHGEPAELAAMPGSRYRALLEAEAQAKAEVWSGAGWTRIRMEDGLIETAPRERPEQEWPKEAVG